MASPVAHTRDDDNSFGPQYGGELDFTLRFEHTILSILPVSLLLASFPTLLYSYKRKPIVVRRGWLFYLKILSAACLFGLETSILVLWTQQSFPNFSSLAIVASSLSCVAACCIIAFLDIEHRHSLQSSSLLSIYLTISILLDIAKSRTCFSRNSHLDNIGSLLAAIASLKGLIIVLEEVPKKAHILDNQQPVSNEATSGFWNRSLFIWLNRTIFLGYCRVLKVDDLEPLQTEFCASNLSEIFSAVWAKTNTASSHSLMRSLLLSLERPTLAIIFPRLCFTAFVYAQTILLQRIVIYVDKDHPSVSYASGLIGATVLIYLGIGISRAVYTHLGFRLVTQARGVLVSQILEKNLKIEYSEANKNSAISLMSTDIESLVTSLPNLHDIWINFIEVGIGTYLLTRVVGQAACLIVVPLLFSTMMSFLIGKRIGSASKAWNDMIQHRVSQTALVFKHIIGVKMLGINPSVSEYIQDLRIAEIAKSLSVRFYQINIVTAAVCAHSIGPVIVIGGAIFWIASPERITADHVYPALATISIISAPLMNIIRSCSDFSSSLGCMKRIQDFLLLEEVADKRTLVEPNQRVREKSEPDMSYSGSREVTPQIDERSIIISAQHLSIKSLNSSYLLVNASFSIRQSTLTIITGPVASGKSTLLRALLGEVKFEGAIEVDYTGNIAYCDQVPWIRNTSIRKNIIGEHSFDALWYESILTACALREDLHRLPDGDETLCGSDGVSLSGGQKHRVALARALYSRSSIIILDDVFSALDAQMSHDIASRLFGSRGLLWSSNTTAIMTSHSAYIFALADTIFFLDGDGNIEDRTMSQRLSLGDSNNFAALQHGIHLSGANSGEKAGNKDKAESENRAKQLAAMEVQNDQTLRRKGDFSLYVFYFRSTKTWMALLWFAILFFSTLAEISPIIYIRIWLEVGPDNNLFYIGYVGTSFLAIVSCAVFFWFFYYQVLPDSSNTLHQRLLNSVMAATMSFLTDTDTGVILNRFSQDVSIITQELPKALMLLIYLGLGMTVQLGVVLSGARFASAVLPLLLLILIVVQHFYLRTSRQMRYLDLEAKTPLYTHFSETAAGLYHIRASGLPRAVLETGLQLLDMSQRPFYQMFALQRWLVLSMDLAALGIATTLVSFGVFLRQTTSQAAIGLSLVALVNLGEDLSSVIQKWTNLETSLGAIARIRAFITETPQEPKADRGITISQDWPASGHIVMSNLTAVYSSTDIPHPVLVNISLEIQPGQKVILFGRSGSGKSSLILTLLNFLSYSGTIHFNGIDITKIPQQVLRSRITTIAQDPLELDGTLRYNLLPFVLKRSEELQTTYDAEAVKVLCRVRLWEYVSSRGGLNAPLSSFAMSSGQKQLIGIARAMLHNQLTGSKIILMDEPTSNLDLDMDNYIQEEVFNKEFSHCTIVMAAHRLETIRRNDNSLFVELAEGRIVQISS